VLCCSPFQIFSKNSMLRRTLRQLSSSSRSPIRGTLAMRENVSDVEVGDYIEMVRGFDREDVRSFGELIGDENPIHDAQDGIVQGHLCSSLFSALLGTKFPGCLYMSQNVKYRRSVHINELIKARVTVRRVMSRGNKILLKCDTTCKLQATNETNDKSIVVDGHALVSVISNN